MTSMDVTMMFRRLLPFRSLFCRSSRPCYDAGLFVRVGGSTFHYFSFDKWLTARYRVSSPRSRIVAQNRKENLSNEQVTALGCCSNVCDPGDANQHFGGLVVPRSQSSQERYRPVAFVLAFKQALPRRRAFLWCARQGALTWR